MPAQTAPPLSDLIALAQTAARKAKADVKQMHTAHGLLDANEPEESFSILGNIFIKNHPYDPSGPLFQFIEHFAPAYGDHPHTTLTLALAYLNPKRIEASGNILEIEQHLQALIQTYDNYRPADIPDTPDHHRRWASEFALAWSLGWRHPNTTNSSCATTPLNSTVAANELTRIALIRVASCWQNVRKWAKKAGGPQFAADQAEYKDSDMIGALAVQCVCWYREEHTASEHTRGGSEYRAASPEPNALQKNWLKNTPYPFSQHFAFAVATASTNGSPSAERLKSSLLRVALERMGFIRISQVACPVVGIGNSKQAFSVTHDDSISLGDESNIYFNYHNTGDISHSNNNTQDAIHNFYVGLWKAVPFDYYVWRDTFVRIFLDQTEEAPDLFVDVGPHKEIKVRKGAAVEVNTFKKKEKAEYILRQYQSKNKPELLAARASTKSTALLITERDTIHMSGEYAPGSNNQLGFRLDFHEFRNFVLSMEADSYHEVDEAFIDHLKNRMYPMSIDRESDDLYEELYLSLGSSSSFKVADIKEFILYLQSKTRKNLRPDHSSAAQSLKEGFGNA